LRPATLARWVVPAARQPVTVRTALPLAVFLAACLGAWVYVTLADVVLFTDPEGFLVLLAAPWIWWMQVAGYGGLRGARAVVALWVRLALLAACAAALAGPRAVRTSEAITVLYTVDLSDSVGDRAVEEALTYVATTVHGREEEDEAGLVVFGRNAAVELPPRSVYPFDEGSLSINSRVARDGTNLADALSLSAAMLSEGRRARIVLLSDGVATEGNLVAALDDLQAHRVPVDVLPIQYEYASEVWLEKLDLPRQVKVGETYEAAVVLSALEDGKGLLVLRENGQPIAQQEVSFSAGKNRYVLPLHLREPGYYEYLATISVPEDQDRITENNTAANALYLEGEGKVLLVVDPEGNPSDWAALQEVLQEARRSVELATAYQFPRNSLSLLPYDCVAFVNVAADAFDAVQLQAVHDAVRDQGLGFLMVGGKNSFGPGGYHRTPVEDALPVSMDITQRKVLPKGALVIILHTCEFPEGNTWAKRIAKRAIRVLGERDEVGVLAYDYQGGESWVFSLTPAAEYERLARLINKAQIGDMPSFSSTMRMGLNALTQSDAAAKHMIIISDGDPSPPPPGLLDSFRKGRISVSTVTIEPHGGLDVQIMYTIAAATEGRHYYPKDPKKLPSIFVKEAKTLKRSMIRNVDFVPEFGMPSPVLKGIDQVPALHGYVLTSPKPSARTVLRAPEEEVTDPVLAVWRYGLGKAAAFTSDLATNWGRDWVKWARYRAFATQLVGDVSRVREESHLHMQVTAEGVTGYITVQDHHPDAGFLEVGARVAGPRGYTEELRCRQVAPGRYEGTFQLRGTGRYRVACAATGGERSETVVGGLVVPYSAEYMRFRANPLVLEQIADKTGGRVLTGDEDGAVLFRKDQPPRISSRSVLDWFLFALACLIPLDVGVRRIQIDWAALVNRVRGRGGRSTATMRTLLRRKGELARAEEARERQKGRSRARPKTGPARPGAGGKPGPRKEAPGTTTGRLVERKRKWRDK